MIEAKGYAAKSADTPLVPFSFKRRALGPKDVWIDIAFCGVCHSDVHQARNEWGGALYPMVPGHEIVGRVVKVGSEVRKYKDGDLVGVGCMVDSCRTCSPCRQGLEQYCDNGFTGTYNAQERGGSAITYGGYSSSIVTDEAFVLKVPESLKLEGVAPLLCAGITTYSPLKHWKVGPGTRVGIVGLGGLGHMGVKLARAFGAEVTLFTTSVSKTEDAKRLGAHHVVISKDRAQMKSARGTLDFILDTVSGPHDLKSYLECLKLDGAMCLVGLPEKAPEIEAFNLVGRRRQLAGSLIGGIKETQEMLDFCAKHGIVSDIELIPIAKINEAFERMVRGDVKYRFVIDLKSL